MKQLLILSPRFAPCTSADNQRVIAMIPTLAAMGWSIRVAAVDCSDIPMPRDERLTERLRPFCTWREARAVSMVLMRRFGITSLAMRSRRSLDRLVRAWHDQARFDLVFVSTTEFGLWPLAAAWLRDLKLPYVLDWQDPWVTDYYRQRADLTPPGGRLKYAIMQGWAKLREPEVARRASAHVCVSSHYVRMLQQRYPDIAAERFSVIPFSSVAASLDTVPENDAMSAPRYWAYAGVCGDVMRFALAAFFRALSEQRRLEPKRFDGLRVRFLGTSYADAERAQPTVLPIARMFAVDDIVDESPQRVTPDEARRFLQRAEAIVIPGTDDPGYVASKIQSCLALHKPMLTIFHAGSDVVAMVQDQPGVVPCTFARTDAPSEDALVDDIRRRWMATDVRAFSVRPRQLHEHSAEAMSARLASVFERAMQTSQGDS